MSAVRTGLRAQDNRQRVARFQVGGEGAGVQMVFVIVETAKTLGGQVKIQIPLLGGFDPRRRTQQIERRRTLEGRHTQAMLDGLDVHPPSPRSGARLGEGMVVAIVDQRLERQLQGAARPHEVVTDVSGVRSVPHPNALFEQSVRESKRPHGRRAFESKPLDVQVSARDDGAARPAIGREWKRLSIVFGGLFQF